MEQIRNNRNLYPMHFVFQPEDHVRWRRDAAVDLKRVRPIPPANQLHWLKRRKSVTLNPPSTNPAKDKHYPCGSSMSIFTGNLQLQVASVGMFSMDKHRESLGPSAHGRRAATFLVGFAALSVKLKLLDDASRALMQKLANSWAKHGTACAKSISCRKYKSMHAYIHTMPYHVIPYVYHYISIEMYTILTVAYTCTYSYVCITLKHYTIITITLHSIWTQHRINVFYLLRIYIYIYITI